MKKVVTDNLIKFTGLAFGTRVPVNKYWVWTSRVHASKPVNVSQNGLSTQNIE